MDAFDDNYGWAMATAFDGWEAGATVRILPQIFHVFGVGSVPMADGRVLVFASVAAPGTELVRLTPQGQSAGQPISLESDDFVGTVTPLVLPDGRRMVATGTAVNVEDGPHESHTESHIRLWAADTGQQVGPTVPGQGRCMTQLNLADGRRLLIFGEDEGSVVLLDLPALSVVARLPWHPLDQFDLLRCLSVVHLDGRAHLVMASAFGALRLWSMDWLTDEHAHMTEVARDAGAELGAAVVVPGADGQPLLAHSFGRLVVLRDVRTLDPVGLPRVLPGGVRELAALPLRDGRTLLAAGIDGGDIVLWDLASGQQVGPPLAGHESGVTALAAVPMPDGRSMLASGSVDSTVRLWTPERSAPVAQTVTGHAGPVLALAAVGGLAGGNAPLASAGQDRSVRLWRADGEPVGEPLLGHTGAVLSVAAPPGSATTGPLVVSGSGDRTVRRWDPVTGVAVGAPLTGHSGAVRAVTAGGQPGQPLVVSAGVDATVRRWDAATGQPVGQPLRGHEGAVLAVVTLVAGVPMIASGGDDGTVRLWNLLTGAALGRPLTGHNGAVRALAALVVAGRPLLVSGGDDAAVRLWDPVAATAVGELRGHTAGVRAVAALAGGGEPLVAPGGDDRSIRLWDPVSYTQVGAALVDHTDGVRALASLRLADGSEKLASAGADATVKL
ncbi:WD40 repeat domain-containing protein, partial [Frankia sp. CcWB2]